MRCGAYVLLVVDGWEGWSGQCRRAGLVVQKGFVRRLYLEHGLPVVLCSVVYLQFFGPYESLSR